MAKSIDLGKQTEINIDILTHTYTHTHAHKSICYQAILYI